MSPEPLRVVVVEDEDRARRTLRTLLAERDDVRLVAETAGGEAPGVLAEHAPDIVFLDVQMPGMDGFEVLGTLDPEDPPVVVFVTAYDRYALEAFDVAAVDYLLKPFSDRRFAEAVDRAVERVGARDVGQAAEALGRVMRALDAGPSSPAPPERLLVRDGARTLMIPPRDIDWIEADDVYVRIHSGPRHRLVRDTLASLEDRLTTHGFFRIHRSALVNLDRVVEFRHRSHGDYTVVLRGGRELVLSRTRRAALEERLGSRLS